MDYQQLFNTWKKRWVLTNPAPEKTSDWAFKLMLFVLVIGSGVLSGSRTGLVVSDIGAFTRLMEKLGYLGLNEAVWIALEALLAFATFEIAIILGGYTNGPKWIGPRIGFVLLFLALFPALAANLYPAWLKIEAFIPFIAGVGVVVVDALIGLSTPIMAFLAGVLFKMRTEVASSGYVERLKEYEDKLKAAWWRSPEYRAWKAVNDKQIQPEEEIEEESSDEPEFW